MMKHLAKTDMDRGATYGDILMGALIIDDVWLPLRSDMAKVIEAQ